MGRKLCVGKPELELEDEQETGLDLAVATSHWESLNNTEIRKEQLAFTFKEMEEVSNAVVFGDTNWYTGWMELPSAWQDAWLALGHTEADGNTFDGKVIPYAAPYRSRLDRFLVKLVDFELRDIRMLGMEPFEEGKWISDHAGLWLELRRIARDDGVKEEEGK